MDARRDAAFHSDGSQYPRRSQARATSARNRRQRLAVGAVLATTGLLGTYLAALRPQPTYAAPLGADTTQQPPAGRLLGPAISTPTIHTCADAAPQDVVSDDTQLRAAILRSRDDSVICISGTITLQANLPTLDDTTLTLVGDDSAMDGIDGRDLHRLVSANLIAGGGDDTVYLANLALSNGFGSLSGGGAVRIFGGGLVISDSTLSGNDTDGSGGALFTYTTNVIIDGSVLQGNTSTSGGAAYFNSSTVAITETTFVDNVAAYSGAAIFANNVDLTAAMVSVSDNTSTDGTGAVSIWQNSTATFSNSFIGRNDSPVPATFTGGIFVAYSDLELLFTTVYDNAPGPNGTDIVLLYGDLTAIGSVVGNSTNDTPSVVVMASGTIDDTYSISTGPVGGFSGSDSQNVPGGTLGLGTGPLTGSGPGRPGLSPASTSVLVTGAPSSSLTTGVNVDQLGNPRPTPGGSTWTIGARQFTGSAPPPPPVYPPSAPRNAVAEPGDRSATVSWDPPTDPGSFPITNYRVTAQPGGRSCLVQAPETSCVLGGLTNGQPYTFTVEALNGAGWGPPSEASNPVTPGSRVVRLVLDQGVRVADGTHDRIRTTGSSVNVPAGVRLTPYIRFSGQTTFQQGKTTIVVQSDGTFRWTRRVKNNRGLTAYVAWEDVESNKVFWARIR